MCDVMKFEFVEHTADVGVKAYGSSLKEQFENAALGMFSLIADLDNVESVGEFKVTLKAPDSEQLLVDWLGELLYIHEVYDVLLKEFTVDVQETDESLELIAVVKGEQIDPSKHNLKTMVKAVTYHMLEVSEEKGYLFVLFDV